MRVVLSRLLRYYRRFHSVVWLLVAGEALEALGRFMVQPFIALYLYRQGTDLGVIGLVLAAGPAANLVIGMAGGSLVDGWGRRPVLILGTLGGGLALMGFGLVSALPALAALHFVNTAFRSLYRPANFAAMADVTAPALRMEALGLRRVGLNIGAAVGPAIGAWFFSYAPRAGFLVAGAISLVLGMLFLLTVPETMPAGQSGRANPGGGRPGGGWRAVLADRAMLLFLLSGAAGVGCYRLFDSYLGILVTERLSAWVFPAMVAFNAVLVIILQLPINMALREHRLGSLLLAGSALYMAGWAGFAVPGLGTVFVSTAIFTLGEMVHSAGSNTFVAAIAPPHLRGRYEGFNNLRELGRSVVPLGAGYLMAAGGDNWLFVLAVAAAAASGLLGWAADRVAAARANAGPAEAGFRATGSEPE